MGIEFGSKVKKTDAEKPIPIKQFLEQMVGYAKSAKSYYEQGFPAQCRGELYTLIWYAENIRERIKRENPELWK